MAMIHPLYQHQALTFAHKLADRGDILLCLANTKSNLAGFAPYNNDSPQNQLSRSEKVQLAKRKQPLAKQEYLLSRLLIKQLAKHALARLKQVKPQQLNSVFNHQTKQLELHYRQQALPLRVVISHSQGQVAVAVVAHHPQLPPPLLGLDIEQLNPSRKFTKLADHFYHRDEAHLIANNAANFYRIWTLKEAYAKASSQPIARLLSQPINSLINQSQLIPWCGQYQGLDISVLCSPKQKITAVMF